VLFVRDYLPQAPPLVDDAAGAVQKVVRWRTLSRMAEADGSGREELVRPVRLDPRGLVGPTRGQARGARWRRSSHGFYVPSSADPTDVEQRILEASVVVPPAGAVTGWAALRWLGANWISGIDRAGQPLPVPLLISTHDIRKQDGLLLSGEGCSPETIDDVDGVRVTSPAWSVAFAMRYAKTVRDAVITFDVAAYDDLVSLSELSSQLAAQSGWTGVPLGRKALPYCGENSWSPMEADTRVLWAMVGGFPLPLQNVPLFDFQGRHIGTPDLLDPVAGVIGEYDGPDHLRPEQRVTDINREARFRAHYLEIVVRSAGDPPDAFLRRLDAAYRRARRRRTSRTWTIDPPSWWTSTTTVAQRRALTPEQRSKLLKHRMR